MMIPFEKLEKLLYDKVYRQENHENINKILSMVIIQAVGSGNPSKVIQDYLTFYNGLYWKNKMIFCVAKSMNVNSFTASTFLKGLVLDGDKQNYT